MSRRANPPHPLPDRRRSAVRSAKVGIHRLIRVNMTKNQRRSGALKRWERRSLVEKRNHLGRLFCFFLLLESNLVFLNPSIQNSSDQPCHCYSGLIRRLSKIFLFNICEINIGSVKSHIFPSHLCLIHPRFTFVIYCQALHLDAIGHFTVKKHVVIKFRFW